MIVEYFVRKWSCSKKVVLSHLRPDKRRVAMQLPPADKPSHPLADVLNHVRVDHGAEELERTDVLQRVSVMQETAASFYEVSLCLSRACLGKMMVLSINAIKWRQKSGVFLPEVDVLRLGHIDHHQRVLLGLKIKRPAQNAFPLNVCYVCCPEPVLVY
jgi:hypothetical protein